MRIVQGEDKSLKQLLLYVVIASFRKLAHRVHHARSKPFFEVLSGVDLKGIDFDKAKPDTTPTHSEISIDNACLADFLKNHRPDQYEYKRLQRISFKSAKKKNYPTTIYHKGTFEEFHRLLLTVLTAYETQLGRMKAATGNDQTSKDAFKKAAANVVWAGYLLHKLTTGAALRMHLQTIANSLPGLGTSSLHKSREKEARIYPIQDEVKLFRSDDDLIAHQTEVPFNEGNASFDKESHNFPQDEYQHDKLLSSSILVRRVIAPDEDAAAESEHASEEEDPSDNGHAIANSARSDNPDNNTPDDVDDGEPDRNDKDEDEFEEITSNDGQLPVLKWIKLLVSQFRSAFLLVWGLKATSISLQILKSPQVGTDLMPWKELLDSDFFPRRLPNRPGSRLWSNEDIAKFLDSGVRANRRLTNELAKDADRTWQGILKAHQSRSDHQPLFDRVVEIVSELRDCTTVPGCKVAAEDILAVLKKMAALPDSAQTKKVSDHLDYILGVCHIFSKLSATKFSGSLHCEAALGTLISTLVNRTHPEYSSLLAEFQVSHAVYDLHPSHFG